ncbi:conjugal transfer protein [Streptomyces sp. NRRL S-350]|uniref:conjugal transfer protein n=1 Tax=Streptomyces sp. NRRL S-350 TaxID=1463902 RepID=UPI0004BE4C32|nr:conjugal transfer protein [Streptomyces sp. NRRL S-350]
MNRLSARRNRAPDTPSPIASGTDLHRSRARTVLLYGGIWAALAAGPLALALAIALPQTARSTPEGQAAAPIVIAPPVGYAENFVDLWLRSTDADTDAAALRAMAPGVDLPKSSSALRTSVVKTVAVRSTPMGGRTWQVTVAATVVVPPASPQGARSPQGSTQSSTQAPAAGADVPQGGVRVVRYFAVQVSMVRSDASGGAPDSLVVTGAPAQVAAPGSLTETDPATRTYGSQVMDGPLRETVTGYLTAYLSGVGDSSRYLAPTAKIPTPGAAYSKVSLKTLTASNAVPSAPADGTVLEVLADVVASDSAGEWPLSYPLRLTARAGRWEIAALAPAGTAASSSGAAAPTSTTTNGASR